MAVNVNGIWNCCKSAVPAMRRSGGGSIVNIASLAATYGLAYAIHYTTSSATVIGMTRGLARELGRENIRVNAIAPIAVLTEGTQEFFGAKHAKAGGDRRVAIDPAQSGAVRSCRHRDLAAFR